MNQFLKWKIGVWGIRGYAPKVPPILMTDLLSKSS
jgi:hypothetical protein